jgi:hypothetical protein
MVPPAQPELSKEQILDMIRPALTDLLRENVRGDVDREKTQQYAEARKAELYDRGIQYVVPDLVNGNIVDFSPINGALKNPSLDKASAGGLYDYVVNDIRGYRRKYVAVLGSRSPNLKAVPMRRDNDLHVQRARIADTVLERLDGIWKRDRAHRQIALGLWKSGTMFLYTPFVANGERYGVTREPVIEMRQTPVGPATLNCVQCGSITPVPRDEAPPIACPECGSPFGPEDYQDPEMIDIPEIVDVKEYPNGCAELHVCSIFTVTTPFWIKDLTEAPWLWYEYEEHKGALLAAYPNLEQLIGDKDDTPAGTETGAQAQGMIARATTASPTGTYIPPRKNRWTYSRFWLRPSMYWLMKGAPRDLLLQYYPKGLKVTQVQDKIVDIEHERLDHVWAMIKPETSETIYADPTCKDFMSGQDLINDFHNMTAQTYQQAVPQTLLPTDIIDFQTLKKRRGIPGEYIPIKPGISNIKERIQQMPTAKPEPMMNQWVTELREHLAENIGITRTLFGGALPGDRTAHEAEIMKNQAMMQLSEPWQNMRDGWADAARNAIIQMALHSGGRIPSADGSDSEVEEIELEDLLNGGWYIRTEESMPMSWSERRSWIGKFLENQPPEMIAQVVGLGSPDNIPSIQETWGLTNWKIPMSDARDKVLDTIRMLLRGEPIKEVAPDGTIQLMPSIPIDEFEDDHQFSANEIKQWAQTKDGREAKQTNPLGYANVIAWGKAHQMLAQIQAAPMIGPDGQAPQPKAVSQPASGAPSGASGDQSDQLPSLPPLPEEETVAT